MPLGTPRDSQAAQFALLPVRPCEWLSRSYWHPVPDVQTANHHVKLHPICVMIIKTVEDPIWQPTVNRNVYIQT